MNKLRISDLSGWVMSRAIVIVSNFDMLNNKYTKVSDDRPQGIY